MSKKVARQGDKVSYACVRGDLYFSGSDGTIVQSSGKTRADKKGLARDGDSVICGKCGPGKIRATAKNRCDGRRIARIGDTVTIDGGGSARIISGSSKTRSD